MPKSKIPAEKTFDEILSRDVPIIVAHSRARGQGGDYSPIRLYYKFEAICGQSDACAYDLERDGWIKTDKVIPCNVAYTHYYPYVANFARHFPIYDPSLKGES